MNWKKAAWGIAAAIPVVALLGFGMTRDPKDIPSPLPGRVAPTWSLATFTGPAGQTPDSVKLADMKGKVVVLNFWASWCLACRDEHQALRQIGQLYSHKDDVKFFGVLYNDSPENGRKWLGMMGDLDYPALLDPASKVAIDYGLYGVPETYFIGRDGKVAFKQTGPVTEELLMRKIEELRKAPLPAGATNE